MSKLMLRKTMHHAKRSRLLGMAFVVALSLLTPAALHAEQSPSQLVMAPSGEDAVA